MYGDGCSILKEISVENGGITFLMQLWAESPATVVTGEGEFSRTFTQRSFEKKVCRLKRYNLTSTKQWGPFIAHRTTRMICQEVVE